MKDEKTPEKKQERKAVPELLLARKILQDHAMEKDLEQIRQQYPKLQAKNARELGSRFFALMATGVLDPVTAYEAVLRYDQRHADPKAPPILGAVQGTGAREKDFYTPEEVDRMTAGQLKDQKTLKKIIHSMTKW